MEDEYFKIQLKPYGLGRCYVGFSGSHVMKVIPGNGAYFTDKTIKHPMIQRFLQDKEYRKVDFTAYNDIKRRISIFDYSFNYDPLKS